VEVLLLRGYDDTKVVIGWGECPHGQDEANRRDVQRDVEVGEEAQAGGERTKLSGERVACWRVELLERPGEPVAALGQCGERSR
jgi:hypothetical protein